MICSESRLEIELKKITDIFLFDNYPEKVILSCIEFRISKFNKNKILTL